MSTWGGSEIDPSLVARAIGGDRGALEELVRGLERPILALARHLLHERHEAEDGAQEALVRIVTRLSTFRGEANFTTWAWRVATNAILDQRRGHARRPLLSFQAFADDLREGLADRAAGPQERAAVAELKVQCGRALLQCLGGDHRLAYVLGEVFELDSAVAAKVAGVTPATFRKRLSRARARVHSHLRRSCGVVDSRAACRCDRRLPRARALGRVSDGRDGGELDVEALQRRVQGLEALADRVRAFFRADPERPPERALASEVLACLDSTSETP